MKLSIKIEDLELRSCNRSLGQKGKHDRLEIVKWNDDMCHTLAHWHDYNLQYCIDRPLKPDVDFELFHKLTKVGYSLLKEFYNII